MDPDLLLEGTSLNAAPAVTTPTEASPTETAVAPTLSLILSNRSPLLFYRASRGSVSSETGITSVEHGRRHNVALPAPIIPVLWSVSGVRYNIDKGIGVRAYRLGPLVVTFVLELPLEEPGVIAVPHKEVALQSCKLMRPLKELTTPCR